jgi:dextranase
VYGAEPEYALAHPDELLYDAEGTPHSLEQLFYIMNIHPGSPWRARILSEMARAVRTVPFDGLHLDQYGFPKEAAFGPGPDPVAYDLAADFPAFIDDARAAVRRTRPDARVIFNAVGNWPIAAVAPTTQDATYVEVWPPDETYTDLQRLILEARHLAPSKQVILAAYLKPLQGATGAALPPAEAATRLASAAIWANGGFHLLLGEANGALCDPYYPAYATLRPVFARVMRRYYDFVVRYENALSDPRLRAAVAADGGSGTVVHVRGAPASPSAEPGTVWAVARAMPGLHTVSLINLRAATDARWNVPQAAPPPLHNLDVEVRVDGQVQAAFAASPDGAGGRPHPLPYRLSGHDGATWVRLRLPRLDYWSLIVIKTMPQTEGGRTHGPAPRPSSS